MLKVVDFFFLFFLTSQTQLQTTTNMDVETEADLCAKDNIENNIYYFTFESKDHPEEEEFGLLGLGVMPYLPDVNPERPLGRPLNHSEDQATLLLIPKLLPPNCLDKDQYPWNILCSGPEGWKWDWKRHQLYLDLNVGAYKAKSKIQQSSITPYQHPPASQSAMSTVTETALQTSYP